MSADTLDEIRFAVGEACSRAVSLHRTYVPTELVTVALEVGTSLVVSVLDGAPAGSEPQAEESADAGSGQLAGLEPDGLGLALLRGLVEDLQIIADHGGTGTTIRMCWPLPAPAPQRTA